MLVDHSIPANERWMLLLDFKNAFNSISREAMFNEIRARVLSSSDWLECCYGVQLILYLGVEVIRSCRGVQQGDPLAPLGFALTLHLVVAKVLNLQINAWYLDDGTLCGSSSELTMTLKIIDEEGPPRVLFLNLKISPIHP